MPEMNLYQKLSEKIGMGDSRIVPRLFKFIAGEREAELLLSLPCLADDYAFSSGLSGEEVERMLSDLFRKGVVFKKKKKKDEGMLYRMSRDVVQFHDASILWPDAPRAFLDLWQEFMDEEWPVISEKAQESGERPVGRILPVGESISDKQQILACEDVLSIIDNAKKIAVTNCTCRLTARKCDAPVEICLQVDGAADYTLERGTGREVDRDEARRMIYQAEEAGLIHATMNREGNLHFICNCCPCCCMVFPLLIHRKLNTCDPSRFQAVVSTDDCNGCMECLQRCHFGAITIDDTAQTASVDSDTCMGCGLCHSTCPEGAVSLVQVRGRDFIPS